MTLKITLLIFIRSNKGCLKIPYQLEMYTYYFKKRKSVRIATPIFQDSELQNFS